MRTQREIQPEGIRSLKGVRLRCEQRYPRKATEASKRFLEEGKFRANSSTARPKVIGACPKAGQPEIPPNREDSAEIAHPASAFAASSGQLDN